MVYFPLANSSRVLRRLPIRTHFTVKNANNFNHLEQSDQDFFATRSGDNTIGAALPGYGGREMLQTLSANHHHAAILQQDGKFLEAFLPAPNNLVTSHHLRTHYFPVFESAIHGRFCLINVLADQIAADVRVSMAGHGFSPQHQGLLCDHLLIVPELNPVQARRLEQAVADAKRNSDDFERVVRQWDRARPSAEHHLAGVSMSDFDPSLSRPAALGQLEENAYFSVQQRKGRLFHRSNRTDQARQGHSARVVRVGLNVLADDQVSDSRMQFAHNAATRRLPNDPARCVEAL
jgi:hypothetical protein